MIAKGSLFTGSSGLEPSGITTVPSGSVTVKNLARQQRHIVIVTPVSPLRDCETAISMDFEVQ